MTLTLTPTRTDLLWDREVRHSRNDYTITRDADNVVRLTRPDGSYETYNAGTDDGGGYWFTDQYTAEGQWEGRDDHEDDRYPSEGDALYAAHEAALAQWDSLSSD